MDSTIEKFISAAERGFVWIAEHQREDGSFCDPGDEIRGYYKVPYALSVSGRQRRAIKLAAWIAKHHFTPEGDFGPADNPASGPGSGGWPVYGNAWLVQGLHRIGRWDLSLGGAEFLLRFQLPIGGFYALDGETRRIEPVCTSWGGLASLATGNLEVARRAGDVLVRMVQAQPDPFRFYFVMDPDGELVTDVPPGRELFHYVDSELEEQIYYAQGIALIFLTHLYRGTGKERYLDACRKLLSFSERCADDVYRFPPSGKLGLGCALLYQLTGSQDAKNAAVQVGQYLVETQTAEGIWHLPEAGPYIESKYRDNFEVHLDIAAEFSIFLTEIAWRL